MGSNEEQPLRRFAVWLGGSVRGALSAVVPVKAFRRRRKSLEDEGNFTQGTGKRCRFSRENAEFVVFGKGRTTDLVIFGQIQI